MPAAASAITDPVTRPLARSCMNIRPHSRLSIRVVQLGPPTRGALAVIRPQLGCSCYRRLYRTERTLLNLAWATYRKQPADKPTMRCRRYRTQEVAGSSPASSTSPRSLTLLGERPRSEPPRPDAGGAGLGAPQSLPFLFDLRPA